MYEEIWRGETFIRTDEKAKLLIAEKEQLRLLQTNLTYCETDSIFPENAMDSLALDFWNYKPTQVTVAFEVDEQGQTSNFDVLPFVKTNKRCQELAIQFVKTLEPWKPASIKGIKVRTLVFYEIDFANCNSH